MGSYTVYSYGLIQSEVELSDNEVEVYTKMGRDRYGDNLRNIDIKADGDPDYLQAKFVPKVWKPFERIRRITGYLSSVSNFNDAKMAELKDRVKHRI